MVNGQLKNIRFGGPQPTIRQNFKSTGNRYLTSPFWAAKNVFPQLTTLSR
jgi:hypothetical protein